MTMRLFIYGMGPGETAQGLALARAAQTAGHAVTMAVAQPLTLGFLDALDGPKKLLPGAADVRAEIERGGYDAIVFCNSKAFGHAPAFQRTPPTPRPPTFSLDTNWLFDHPAWYPHIQWLDRILIGMPADLYRAGLRAGGGHYEIPPHTLDKIQPVGFIPAHSPPSPDARAAVRRALGLQPHQRLVFSYFGRAGTYLRDFFPRYLQIMDACARICGDALRVLHFGEDQPKAAWVICDAKDLDRRRFYPWLAAADLVFQHHGLSTLMQALSARVPAVANVWPARPGCRHALPWELGPFERAGLCALHLLDDPIEHVAETVQALLFPSPRRTAMLEAQQRHFVPGEPRALAEIARLAVHA